MASRASSPIRIVVPVAGRVHRPRSVSTSVAMRRLRSAARSNRALITIRRCSAAGVRRFGVHSLERLEEREGDQRSLRTVTPIHGTLADACSFGYTLDGQAEHLSIDQPHDDVVAHEPRSPRSQFPCLEALVAVVQAEEHLGDLRVARAERIASTLPTRQLPRHKRGSLAM